MKTQYPQKHFVFFVPFVDNKRTFFAALLAAFALGANAQEPAPGALPEQPVTKAQLAPEALAALNAPLEATVTAKALLAVVPPKLSFVSAMILNPAVGRPERHEFTMKSRKDMKS